MTAAAPTSSEEAVAEGGEYLVMLDNYECLAVPMRRVEWRKVAT